MRSVVVGIVILIVATAVLVWLVEPGSPRALERERGSDSAPVAAPPPGAPSVESTGPLPDAPVIRRVAQPTAAALTVSGIVTRRRAAVAGRRVTLRGKFENGDPSQLSTETDALGHYTFDVGPGTFRIGVPRLFFGSSSSSISRPSFGRAYGTSDAARAEIRITDTPVRVDLALPEGRVDVIVRDAVTSISIQGAAVRSNASSGWATITAETDANGTAVFDELEPRRYEFEAHAPLFRSSGDRTVTVDAAVPVVALVLDMEPAAAIDLQLTYSDGKREPLSAALRPTVHHVGTGVTLRPANGQELKLRPRPFVLRYEPIDAGRYQISIDDEVSDRDDGTATIRFQPVAMTTGPVVVEALLRRRTAADISVVHRALIRIRGVDATGTTSRGTTLGVARSRDHRIVYPAPWQGTRAMHRGAHFEGYLAPGTYDLEFCDDTDRVWRERLTVGTESFERTITVPW